MTGINSTVILIVANSFTKLNHFHKLVIYSSTPYSDYGTTAYTFQVNLPPQFGNCTVTPNVGKTPPYTISGTEEVIMSGMAS